MPDPAFLLVSMRPCGGHDGLRRAAGRHGGRVLALSPWRIEARQDAATRQALAAALGCPTVVFTSPAAVHAASALQAWPPRPGQRWVAVGAGTQRALRQTGADAIAPARMDSEGVLDLPAIAGLAKGDRVGIVTAPGGRGAIARALLARGIALHRADVYARVPLPLRADALARLDDALAARGPVFIALSSGEAFHRTLAATGPARAAMLRAATCIAASERLAGLARDAGFARVRVAASARPGDLVAGVVAGLDAPG